MTAALLPQPCLCLWGALLLPRETQCELGEMPVLASKILHTPQAAGGLWPSQCSRRSVVLRHWPLFAPHGWSSPEPWRRWCFQQEDVGNPASSKGAQGCPAEKMLVTSCLKQWPGATVNYAEGFSCPSSGSLPPSSAIKGSIFCPLSFKS